MFQLFKWNVLLRNVQCFLTQTSQVLSTDGYSPCVSCFKLCIRSWSVSVSHTVKQKRTIGCVTGIPVTGRVFVCQVRLQTLYFTSCYKHSSPHTLIQPLKKSEFIKLIIPTPYWTPISNLRRVYKIKHFSCILSRCGRIWRQSLKKVLKWGQKNSFEPLQQGIKKRRSVGCFQL
jgi:hypothetical protein